MRFAVVPSPTEHIFLAPYDGSDFPKFRRLFENSSGTLLSVLALNPEEESAAVVLENRSGKGLTALCYRWIQTDVHGIARIRTCNSDSYMVDIFQPVAVAGTKMLITPSKSVNEETIDRLSRGGGGVLVGDSGRGIRHGAEIAELTFQLDFILFEDGGISGPDPYGYAVTLQSRKRAAEFVAKQIRMAEADGRDVTPVLSALIDIPHFGSLHREQGDRLVQWTQHYARHYLDTVRNSSRLNTNGHEAALHHLENRPELPKFYRTG